MTDTEENINMTIEETHKDEDNIDINELQVKALNTLIELVMMAHKRSVYSLEESAKAWNAIKVFIPDKPEQLETNTSETESPVTDDSTQ
tara:strand:- start:133 stop:399 length:267 start_codon:yes stop_codon:yes gene_type:complete